MNAREGYISAVVMCVAAVFLSCVRFDGAVAALGFVSFPFCAVVWAANFRVRRAGFAAALLCGALMDFCAMPPVPVNTAAFIIYYFAGAKVSYAFNSPRSLPNAVAQSVLVCVLLIAEYFAASPWYSGMFPPVAEAARVCAVNACAVVLVFAVSSYRGRRFRAFGAGGFGPGLSRRI